MQFHNVRAAVGTDTVTDAEAFVVSPDCPAGTDLTRRADEALSSLGLIADPGATVTISRIDDELVEGSVSATFDDGSSFEGSFSVRLCAGAPAVGDDPVCS